MKTKYARICGTKLKCVKSNLYIYDYTGITQFIALCSTALCRYYIFLQTESLQPCTGQVCWCPFSKSICSLHVSVWHLGNSCNILNFSLLLYFWSLIVIVLGHPCKMANLVDVVCFNCSTIPPSLSPQASLSQDKILKLGQLMTLQWTQTVQIKGKVTHLSL